MKKWKTLNTSQKLETEDVIKILLENRGLKTKKEIDEFLNPKLEQVNIKSIGIDKTELRKAIERIVKAIKNKEKIVVFGDYDADGICGTAILWETLHSMGADVMPYIPHRIEEGYGLSETGIKNLKLKIKNCGLIITIDNGIVANKAVDFANKAGIDVIVTDHHVPSKKLPDALAIVHTTKLCGAGVAYLLSQEIKNGEEDNHLELVALATVADLVPLVGANRTLVKFGIEKLRQTKRIGLLELYKESGLRQSEIGVYEIGHIIAPRLNAMGRLEDGIESLRLLCTNNQEKARMLAYKLGSTNRQRQELTIQAVEHARLEVISKKSEIKSLMFISHESYQQGVIGLVAGKLTEEFYRPAIVVSIGEKYSKASARSISGFNIIEFIRESSEFLVDAGGHPMAAGFTVETTKLALLQKTFEEKALTLLDEEKLTRILRVDCELPLSAVDKNLYDGIQNLAPFGMRNPEPVFVSKDVVIEDMRAVGINGKHLKLQFRIQNSEFRINAIAFGMGERLGEFKVGDKVDIAYTIDKDTWNGNKKLQLKVKDLRK
ncbi:MAG: single-stranded-DNA-specific exonuclease RecJ [Candidatus Levybacteria bacterium RIFCSPHIGHO2_01_FULL_38_26]|nr:MAG: single-stranded-DNA-specific exonuclease RecJ [Candidatus Levybacteria bacterium RIFCSPHIGHO2_01_FULL_38_26]